MRSYPFVIVEPLIEKSKESSDFYSLNGTFATTLQEEPMTVRELINALKDSAEGTVFYTRNLDLLIRSIKQSKDRTPKIDYGKHGNKLATVTSPSGFFRVVFSHIPNRAICSLNHLAPDYFSPMDSVQTLQEGLQDIFEAVQLPLSTFLKAFTRANMGMRVMKYHFIEDYLTMVDGKLGPNGGVISFPIPDIADDFIRQAYYGGRNETFKDYFEESMGVPFLNHYDFNGLHTAIMKETSFPTGTMIMNVGDMAADIWQEYVKGQNRKAKNKPNPDMTPLHVYVLATVHIPASDVGPLPVHVNVGERQRLVFPVDGEFTGHWYGEELLYAVQKRGVTVSKVHQVVYWTKEAPIFRNVASFFADGKEHFAKPLSKFFKGMSNTIPGKTAAKRFITTLSEDTPENRKRLEKEGTEYEAITSAMMREKFLEHETESFSPEHRIQFGAAISAMARIRLQAAMMQAKNIYYVDTDSVITPSIFPASMVDQKETGKLKLEMQVTNLVILANKVYAEVSTTGEISVKSSGISSEADLSFIEMSDIYQNREAIGPQGLLIHSSRRFPTFREVARNEYLGSAYVLEEYRYHYRSFSNRRKDYETGITFPYTYEELRAGVGYSNEPPYIPLFADVLTAMLTDVHAPKRNRLYVSLEQLRSLRE